ncbi:hypothetical protein BH23BAC2_BH23BAC2_17940 [soil metagenome]
MKKSILTLAAIALVFSFTSCKETTGEKTEDTQIEVIETEAPAEVIETPEVEEVDTTTSVDAVEVQ